MRRYESLDLLFDDFSFDSCLDSQADYYESSTWLTAEEKTVIDNKESQRRTRLHESRSKVTMTLDLSRQVIIYLPISIAFIIGTEDWFLLALARLYQDQMTEQRQRQRQRHPQLTPSELLLPTARLEILKL